MGNAYSRIREDADALGLSLPEDEMAARASWTPSAGFWPTSPSGSGRTRWTCS